MSIEHDLRRFEEQLLQPDFRSNRKAVSELLADEFREFGSSGIVWTKDQILDKLANEQPFRAAMQDFRITELSADAVLVTYTTSVTTADAENFASLRSSLWIKRDGRWQMLFHQGTPIEQP